MFNLSRCYELVFPSASNFTYVASEGDLSMFPMITNTWYYLFNLLILHFSHFGDGHFMILSLWVFFFFFVFVVLICLFLMAKEIEYLFTLGFVFLLIKIIYFYILDRSILSNLSVANLFSPTYGFPFYSLNSIFMNIFF